MDNKNNQNQEGQQLQIDLSPEIAKGVYTNFQIISHSSSEFVIDFATLLPGVPKATVTSRVIIAPEHALRLLSALQENIVRYKQEFGEIGPASLTMGHVPLRLSGMGRSRRKPWRYWQKLATLAETSGSIES